MLAWILSAVPMNFVARTLQAVDGEDAYVTASAEEGFGALRLTITRELGLAWAPMRAAGPPDTPTMGDNTSAWASLTQDGQPEWLELDYATVESPRSLVVYETLAPGALVRATVIDEQGQEVEAWKGTDPGSVNASGIYVANVPLAWDKPASRMRIYLDSPKVTGWNEIDAVGLVDANGQVQWARSVRASTTYASGRSSSANVSIQQLADELPSWATLDSSASPKHSGPRVFDAYGWPMLAVYRESQSAQIVPTSKLLSVRSTRAPLPPMSFPRPIWLGLLADAALYGGVLLLLYLLTSGIRRAMRESSRLRRGCCLACGYDLRYDFVGGCPECGWNRMPERADLRVAGELARRDLLFAKVAHGKQARRLHEDLREDSCLFIVLVCNS
jgi:hypothetical protein